MAIISMSQEINEAIKILENKYFSDSDYSPRSKIIRRIEEQLPPHINSYKILKINPSDQGEKGIFDLLIEKANPFRRFHIKINLSN